MGMFELAILLLVVVLFFSMPLALIFVVIFVSRSQRSSQAEKMNHLQQENSQLMKEGEPFHRSSQ